MSTTTRAEYALVAGLCAGRFALEDAAGLNPESFSSPRCARALGALRELAAEGQLNGDGVDPSLLCDRARIQARELSEILDALPEAQSPALVYVLEICKASALRDLGQATRQLKKKTTHEAAAYLKEALARYEEAQVGSQPLPLQTSPEFVTQQTRSWLLDGLIPEASVNLLTGSPGDCKSWLMLALGVAASTGNPFLGRRCLQRKAVYIGADMPPWLTAERLELLGTSERSLIWRDYPPLLLGNPVYQRLPELGEGLLVLIDNLRDMKATKTNQP